MKNNHKSSTISFRWNDLAVPEVLIGAAADRDQLLDEEPEETISYDNLALPEIHFSARSRTARSTATA